LSLPIYPEISEETIAYVVERTGSFFANLPAGARQDSSLFRIDILDFADHQRR
jgi:hypothetical protein